MSTPAPLSRTHYCGEVNELLIGQEVRLLGWVRSVREMGGLTFLGLADREGQVQIVVEQTDTPELHKLAKGLRSEFVIAVEGTVIARDAGAINAQMRTGAIEVRATKIEILASAEVPPFPIDEKAQVSEDLGLKYRYLNLRLPALQKNLTLRHRLSLATRNYLSGLGFLEIETPFLYKSTPEGAREFLVPSRVHAGKFYALPQSPQLFKQLLMMAGYDRYFQIVRCFRDEDLRADRQPEFTQIDLEISYPNEETVITLIEGLLKTLWHEAGHEIQIPFRRMGHTEAMENYGSDRPDLRYELKLTRHDDWAAAGDNEFFKKALAEGGSVRGLRVPGGAKYSRKDFDGLTELAKKHGAGGMAFLKWGDEGVTGSVAKSFTAESMQAEFTRIAAEKGDAILFCAGDSDSALKGLGAVRQEVARREKIIPHGVFNFLWVVDFPLFEKMDDGSPKSAHHPFTAPQAAHEAALADVNSDPFAIRARAYDITLNGIELGGGSIRIHRSELQKTLFRRIGLDEAQMQDKFGFLLEALSYGTPPHGGIALGFDRLCALLCGADSLREVIAFPKTTQAADLMVETPSTVTEQQLQDLHIKTRG